MESMNDDWTKSLAAMIHALRNQTGARLKPGRSYDFSVRFMVEEKSILIGAMTLVDSTDQPDPSVKERR
jgi:hypothetical protein